MKTILRQENMFLNSVNSFLNEGMTFELDIRHQIKMKA
jgi:hypothetical protein